MDIPKSGEKMSSSIIIESAKNIPEAKKKEFLDEIVAIEKNAWPPELQASREKFNSRVDIFPQGFLIAKINSKIVGVTTSQITEFDLSKDKTWDEITNGGTIKATHDPSADSLYVVSVGVSSDAQGKGIGGRLVAAQIELTKQLGLRRLFLGARVPGYDSYCKDHGNISIEKYLESKNNKGESFDPEIRFYERQGLKKAKTVRNFEPDHSSRGFGVVMVWENK